MTWQQSSFEPSECSTQPYQPCIEFVGAKTRSHLNDCIHLDTIAQAYLLPTAWGYLTLRKKR
jgi:hypothetical protein